MTAYLSPLFGAGSQLMDNNGSLLAGGKIYTYQAGSSVLYNTWTDINQGVLNANPIILDASGRVPNEIWLASGVAYKLILQDSLSNVIGNWDNIQGVNDLATTIHAATNKTTPVGADELGIWDSVSGLLNKVSFTNLWAQLSGLYASLTSVTGLVSVKSATVTDIFGATGATISIDNSTPVTTTSFTACASDQIGSVKRVIPVQNWSVTASANLVVDGATSGTFVMPAGAKLEVLADTTTMFDLTTISAWSFALYGSAMYPIAPSVGSNALGGSLAACKLDFRNPTLATGTPVSATVGTTLALPAVPTTSSLGATTAQLTYFVYGVAYNGGTPIACIANMTGGLVLDGSALVSPTTIGASSTSNATVYSASACGASSPFTPIAVMGATWVSGSGWTITSVMPLGGSSAIALNSLGYGQTWQTVTRTSGTTYYNTTGKPINLLVLFTYNGVGNNTLTINGTTIVTFNPNGITNGSVLAFPMVTIPVGQSYSFTLTATAVVSTVSELR